MNPIEKLLKKKKLEDFFVEFYYAPFLVFLSFFGFGFIIVSGTLFGWFENNTGIGYFLTLFSIYSPIFVIIFLIIFLMVIKMFCERINLKEGKGE